jgi:hypothetical protein
MMLALTVVIVWFAVVAIFLIRQWWMSELAQARDGVSAPAPVTLPAAAAPAAQPLSTVTWKAAA